MEVSRNRGSVRSSQNDSRNEDAFGSAMEFRCYIGLCQAEKLRVLMGHVSAREYLLLTVSVYR